MPDFYVSPTGLSSNAGTLQSPWSFAHACTGASGSITPGSTVWIMNGIYTVGSAPLYEVTITTACNGTVGNPVRFRGMSTLPWTMPRIRGSIVCNAADFWLENIRQYWDFDTDRLSDFGGSPVSDVPRQGAGINVFGARSQLRNVILHDAASSGFWSTATGFKSFDYIAYNNGWSGIDRGHVHGAYEQTQANPVLPDDIHIHHSPITFSNFGAGWKFAGSANAHFIGITFIGASLFDSGLPARVGPQNHQVEATVYLGGGGVNRKGHITLASSSIYQRDNNFHDMAAADWPAVMGIGDINKGDFPITITDNIIQGPITFGSFESMSFKRNTVSTGNQVLPVLLGRPLFRLANIYSASLYYDVDNNSYFHPGDNRVFLTNGSNLHTLAQHRASTGFDTNSTYATGMMPSSSVQFVPSQIENGKATITIWNHPTASVVNVDVSSVLTPGQSYELYHVYDWVSTTAPTPTLSGMYTGSPLAVPMTNKTPPTPQAWVSLPDLDNKFGVFILRSVEESTSDVRRSRLGKNLTGNATKISSITIGSRIKMSR